MGHCASAPEDRQGHEPQHRAVTAQQVASGSLVFVDLQQLTSPGLEKSNSVRSNDSATEESERTTLYMLRTDAWTSFAMAGFLVRAAELVIELSSRGAARGTRTRPSSLRCVRWPRSCVWPGRGAAGRGRRVRSGRRPRRPDGSAGLAAGSGAGAGAALPAARPDAHAAAAVGHAAAPGRCGRRWAVVRCLPVILDPSGERQRCAVRHRRRHQGHRHGRARLPAGHHRGGPPQGLCCVRRRPRQRQGPERTRPPALLPRTQVRAAPPLAVVRAAPFRAVTA